MSEDNGFDFSKFMADATNVDDATRNEMLQEDLSDEMSRVMGELGPRLWSVIQAEMAKDPKNNIHLNACTNASLFAVLSWIVACTPPGDKNDDMLRTKIMANVDRAIATARDNGEDMARFATNIGRLKLMEDACAGTSKVLVQNSMIISGVHSYIENERKGGV